MNLAIKKFTLQWLPVLVWMVLIFTLSNHSTLPGPQVYLWDYIFKKLAHIIFFGFLFFLFARALNWNHKLQNWTFVWAFIFTILYAFSDELHQSITPGRHSQLTDVGYDTLGAAIMYLKLIRLI